MFEFSCLRCQPLRRALTLSHARVKTSPFVTERYRSITLDVRRTYMCGLFCFKIIGDLPCQKIKGLIAQIKILFITLQMPP
ncbi:hypothetical protein D6V31_19330 [Vibrio cholerae]|nr:hypothetical protein [Vibrio cholerae]